MDGWMMYLHVCVCMCVYVSVCVCVCVCVYVSMYCLYVRVDYTYIDVNALAQGIKSFLASQVWFQAIAGARTYGTNSPTITSQPRYPFGHMYVCMYVCLCMYVHTCIGMYILAYICTYTPLFVFY